MGRQAAIGGKGISSIHPYRIGREKESLGGQIFPFISDGKRKGGGKNPSFNTWKKRGKEKGEEVGNLHQLCQSKKGEERRMFFLYSREKKRRESS